MNKHKVLRIADVMTREIHSVGKDQRLNTAHKMMRLHKIRHLPVLDGRKLVGILSQRDIYFLESLDGVETSETAVEEAMSQDVYRASPSDRVADVAEKMIDKKYGCAVVMEGAKVAGIFTTVDALRTLRKLLAAH